MAPKNCLNYSTSIKQPVFKNYICLDFIGLRVYPTPKITKSKYKIRMYLKRSILQELHPNKVILAHEYKIKVKM